MKSDASRSWRQVSRYHYLTDEEILQCIGTQSSLRRGFRFDEKTRFLVFRIPATSPCQTEAFLLNFRQLLASSGIDSKPYQIDDDWYLYIFLAEWIDSNEAAQRLQTWCEAHQIDVEPGHLEMHPADCSIPFPLQPTFCWLNDRGQVIVRRSEIATEAAIALFLADCQKCEVSPDLIRAVGQDLQAASDMTAAHATISAGALCLGEPAVVEVAASISWSDGGDEVTASNGTEPSSRDSVALIAENSSLFYSDCDRPVQQSESLLQDCHRVLDQSSQNLFLDFAVPAGGLEDSSVLAHDQGRAQRETEQLGTFEGIAAAKSVMNDREAQHSELCPSSPHIAGHLSVDKEATPSTDNAVSMSGHELNPADVSRDGGGADVSPITKETGLVRQDSDDNLRVSGHTSQSISTLSGQEPHIQRAQSISDSQELSRHGDNLRLYGAASSPFWAELDIGAPERPVDTVTVASPHIDRSTATGARAPNDTADSEKQIPVAVDRAVDPSSSDDPSFSANSASDPPWVDGTDILLAAHSDVPATRQESLTSVDQAENSTDNLPGQLFLFPPTRISLDTSRDPIRTGKRGRSKSSPSRSPP